MSKTSRPSFRSQVVNYKEKKSPKYNWGLHSKEKKELRKAVLA